MLQINNLIFSSKELFKNTYPEINLMMIINFNDQINMQEKIFFNNNNNYSKQVARVIQFGQLPNKIIYREILEMTGMTLQEYIQRKLDEW